MNIENKINTYLTEKVTKDVIVVDVQPAYKKYIKFNIEGFTNFLYEQRDILYFYNGESMGYNDNKDSIIDWLCDFNPGLYDKLQNSIWIDKGYGFFRNWMDLGADQGFIKKAIRYMYEKKVNDSRDINTEEWKEKFEDGWDERFEDDCIYLPDISISTLKKWNGGYITGGGKNECLKEIQLLMSVFNIKTKEVKKFIY